MPGAVEASGFLLMQKGKKSEIQDRLNNIGRWSGGTISLKPRKAPRILIEVVCSACFRPDSRSRNWFEMGHVLGSCPYDNASLKLKWRDIVGLYMKADN